MGVVCMSMATLYIPVIVIKARKFALLFSFGSVFFLSSFSMLWGPTNHLKHLISAERLPFSLTYLTSLVGTIYYSVWVRIYIYWQDVTSNRWEWWLSIHRFFSLKKFHYKRRILLEKLLCRRKGETVSTPLDKDGRSSDLYDNTRQGMAASTRHLARFFLF